MKGLWRKLIRDLQTMWPQVITIALLIICGISVMVSSLSSYESLLNAKNAFYSHYRFPNVFAEFIRAPKAILEQIQQIPGVEVVENRIIKEGLVEVPKQMEPALGRFISVQDSEQKLNLVYLRAGRMPQSKARGSQLTEVVVHEAFAKAQKMILGQVLNVNLSGKQQQVQVVGIGISPEYVYALSPVAPLPDDLHFGVFWILETDLASWTGMEGALNSLQIKLTNIQFTNEIRRQLDLVLSPYGETQSYDRTKQTSNVFVEDEIHQQKVMAAVMPIIFLGVAMFILNIILSRLVASQRSQIATLKALGYSAGSIVGYYFILITLILLIGIFAAFYLGNLIGKWYAGLYADFFRFPSIDFSLSAKSIVLGLLAGLIPGWLASARSLFEVHQLQPAEAMRPPIPRYFAKSVLDPILEFFKASEFSRIIFRSLFFRPVRLILGIIGMALALAILINGSYWFDVVDYMMTRQFHEMRREDLTVQLLRPQGQLVYSELMAMPGVIMIEGERSIPVRFQYKNVKKDSVFLGWDQGSVLSRTLDKNGKEFRPLQGGIMLSQFFQAEYGVKIGETVRLKAVQGGQQEFEVPVLGFVEDLVGQQIYALKSDVHAWLKEKPVVNTLNLKIDPAQLESIYVQLKQRPEVLGITVRKLLLQGFNQLMGNMILTMTMILFLFAMAIAGAVMYNSVRISFAERSWELASLRILGFSNWQTFNLLFIDIGIQVLLALIPGMAIGFWFSYLSTYYIENETYKFPLVIEPATYSTAVLVLLFTFLVSGIFLYNKVKKLDFSEALKARE